MIKTSTDIVPESTITKSTYFCDICGRDLQNDKLWGINAQMSYQGDHAKGMIDICERCMRTAVMPMVCSVYKIKPR